MNQQPHDQYAKKYLSNLLDEVAEIQLGYEVLAEARRVDVYTEPKASAREEFYQALGVLGRMTRQPCLLEPFSDSPSREDVRQCLGKLFSTQHNLQLRQTGRKQPPLSEAELPTLWILAPTASADLTNGFGGHWKDDWCEGIHFLPPHFKTAIVAIHQLPKTPETAWLRALGRGNLQQRTFRELLDWQELPLGDPREILLRRVAPLFKEYTLLLQSSASSPEEQELIMNVLATYEQWERETLWKQRQEGRQEGQQEGLLKGLLKGRQEERREVVETLLKTRFGPDETLLQRLDLLSQMPLNELLPWLLNVSKEELRAKLGLN